MESRPTTQPVAPLPEYVSTSTAAAIAARLRAARSVVLLTHAKPDGDAIGSLVGLHRALERVGVGATSVVMGPLEPALMATAESTPLRRLERDGPPPQEPEVVALLDTGSWSQLEPIATWLRSRVAKTVGVDHHRRGDDVAGAGRIVVPSCASTTQALLPVIEALGVSIDAGAAPDAVATAASTEPIATPLYMGLATDTGWFKFSNADAAVFALASRLVAAGARKEWLYAALEQNARPARLALTARALASMRLIHGDRVAIMTLSPDDFATSGGGPEEIGGLVNEPMVLASVRVSVLVSQHEPGMTRVSFRSKPGVDGAGAATVDVNAIAARLGGGGHVQAAGAKLAMALSEAVKAVEAVLEGTAA